MMKAKPVRVDSADTTSVDVDVVRRVKAVTTEDWALALLAVVLASKGGPSRCAGTASLGGKGCS
jgi:hypothetical protein